MPLTFFRSRNVFMTSGLVVMTVDLGDLAAMDQRRRFHRVLRARENVDRSTGGRVSHRVRPLQHCDAMVTDGAARTTLRLVSR